MWFPAQQGSHLGNYRNPSYLCVLTQKFHGKKEVRKRTARRRRLLNSALIELVVGHTAHYLARWFRSVGLSFL